MKEPWLVVLGAVLALMTSVAVEFVRFWLQQSRIRKLLTTLLQDEIRYHTDTIDQIVDETPKLGFIPLMRIAELEGTRQGFDRNRDWIILYRDEKLRRDIFAFYQELARMCIESRSIEGMSGDQRFNTRPGFATQYAQMKNDASVKFTALAGKGRNIIQSLKMIK